MDNKEKEYTFSEAARFLGCSRQNIAQQVEREHIAVVWRGHKGTQGKRMIQHSALLAYVWSDYFTGFRGKFEANEGGK